MFCLGRLGRPPSLAAVVEAEEGERPLSYGTVGRPTERGGDRPSGRRGVRYITRPRVLQGCTKRPFPGFVNLDE